MTRIGTVAPHACPRCQGRLFTGRDVYGIYSTCLACGFVREWVSGPAVVMSSQVVCEARCGIRVERR